MEINIMKTIKCITFDKKAQNNLPQHIKDKMKAGRDKARKEIESKGLNTNQKELLIAFGFYITNGKYSLLCNDVRRLVDAYLR